MNNFQKFTVFFCTGVLSVQWLDVLPAFNYLMVTAIFSLLMFKRLPWLSFFMLGFVWAAGYSLSVQHSQLPSSLEGQEVMVTGQVVGLPIKEARSIRFLLRLDSMVSEASEQTFPRYMRLNWYGRGKYLRSGEKWQFLVKLKRPHGLANPYGFDYEKWLFQQRIGATGYVRQSKNNHRVEKASRWDIGSLRESLKEYLDESLVGSEHLGVVKALVLGDRSDINSAQWDVFRKTGTSHLIAISGLHIGLVSALIFGFVRWLVLRVPRIREQAMRYAIIVSLMGAGLYAGLAGFSVPTQRALIMLSIVMGAVFWQRHYTPFHIISVALVAVLMFDPLAVMSAGFWLSFGAVAVILYSLVGRIGTLNWMGQLFQIQWWVAIGLMPLVLYFFQQVSLVAPLANMLAVPFVSVLVVPLLLFALLVSVLSASIGVLVLSLVDRLIDFMWFFLEFLSNVTFSFFTISSVSIVSCVIAMIGVVLVLLPKGLIPKPLACALFIPLFFPIKSSQLKHAEFELALLDVGQGLSAVIQTTNHVLVFDTGAKYNEKSDLASNVILPYLHGKQVDQLDALVISHADNDHAGGAKTLLANIKVNSLSTSVPEMFIQINARQCQEKVRWVWDGVEFEFLSPSRFKLFKGNDGSCVLKVSSINGSVLLPGDIERSAERSLLQYKAEQLKVDVIVAPHHGSKTSSTLAFIEAVNPRYVLFPVGYKNRFGFPKQEVVERYTKQGVISFDTANHGALTVKFLANKPIEIESYREAHSTFWNWVR
ncbi:MAG TPA: DNA internalization-related competence protein ComEC/Rec2 [Cycloclasticus sp.]|nr:DNA internalization-related competence protein ComEC/Rec2 [Cycloclasticus sp.]HIL91386.1 DNA internalization-related competence protein ComEC/Rec2 [Cycloclasticus sp.]